jgi:Protein of unknown function (DUF1353)
MKAAFLTPLTVQQKPEDDSQDVASGRGVWTLVAPLEYQSEAGPIYSVPIGFKTDFASVPRIPFIFEAFGDKANLSSTLHDFLYSKQSDNLNPPIDRQQADSLLREATIAQGCSEAVAEALYLGVRAGGESHWKTD